MKKKRLGCLNMVQFENANAWDIEKKYIEEDPMFVVANDRTQKSIRDRFTTSSVSP